MKYYVSVLLAAFSAFWFFRAFTPWAPPATAVKEFMVFLGFYLATVLIFRKRPEPEEE